MKLDKAEIMKYAVTEVVHGNTLDPYEALVIGLQRYLTKNKLVIISEQEYACFMEQQKYIQDGESAGEALKDSPAPDVD